MKLIIVAVWLVAALSLPAAAPQRGKERLRELAVFPLMRVSYSFNFQFVGADLMELTEEAPRPERIAKLQQELKQRPADIPLQLKLGRLLDENGETNASRVCLENVLQLCRQKVESRPRDGLALAELGNVLSALDQDAEAESVYRKATLVSSNESKCWIGLGQCLDTRSGGVLMPAGLRHQINPTQTARLQKILDSQPTQEALKEAATLQKESSECFDRAVVLAPKEPEVFLRRAGHLCSSNWIASLIGHFRFKETISPEQWNLNYYSLAAVPDLQRAAQLSPRSYRLIGAAAWFEWIACVRQRAWEEASSRPALDTLPAGTQQAIHAAITRLENLGQDPDKKFAAGALQCLATVRMLVANDPQACKSDLRRAVALDPSRDSTWELLLGLALDSEPPAEIQKLCEARLKASGTPRNQLLLAKILAKQEKFDSVAVHAGAALDAEPANVVAHVFLAAVAIRKSSGEDSLAPVEAHLNAASKALMNMSSSEEKILRTREFLLNLAIWNGLRGDPAAAREALNFVVKNFPDDATAKEILKALE